jgi:DNA-binding CsgD family transcriptional regulator
VARLAAGRAAQGLEASLPAANGPPWRCRRLAGLTPRELEVLRLIASGLTAKEVARRLDIAPKTADNHIQSLYAKIGVATRAAAALYAVEQGMVNQDRAAA